MRILDRYIARQVITAAVIALLVLTVVMVFGNIFKRLLTLPTEVLRDMPAGLLGRFVGYALVASLPFTIPWSLLTAVLLVFGRMSADNELLAVRMAGWSFARACGSIFVLAGLCTAFCFWVNLLVAPVAEAEIKRLPAVVATANPKALLGANRIIDQIDDFIVYVGGKANDDELTNFQMIMLGEKRFPSKYMSARHVKVTENPEAQGLDLELRDSVAIMRDEETAGIPDSGPRNVQRIKAPMEAGFSTQTVSLRGLYEKLERISPDMMSLRELGTRLSGAVKESRDNSNDRRARTAARASASELRTEINHRFSFSLASIVFALVGVPLGVTAQRRETSVGFGLSLVIGIVYLSFFMLSDSVFKTNPEAMPWLLVWVPNVIFLVLGGWLFLRLQRR